MMSAGEVIDLIGCGRSTFYKWIRAKKFPEGRKINGLRKWWESAVLEYINGGSSPDKTPPHNPSLKPKRKRLPKHIKK
jgi:predicted DNA-binding transcriptional regulator AlpA